MASCELGWQHPFLDKEIITCDNESNRAYIDMAKSIYRVFVVLVAAWCAGILLAPLLVTAAPGVSSLLYLWYEPVCHQIDARSFHLFGAKLAVCARCSSLYFGFLFSVLMYPLVRQVVGDSVPHRAWVVLAVVPMIIDVVLNVTGIHFSTLFTRSVSGALFGLILPLYLIPVLTEAVTQLRDQLSSSGGPTYARKAQ